jgi:very-short-patch-repair endonuclease
VKDLWVSERLVAAIGASNDGIVVTSELDRAGVSLAAVQRMRRRSVLVSLGLGVDRLRDHPFGYRSQCRAALALAGEGAGLGLRTAARWHGCWAYRSHDVVEVVVDRRRDHRTSVGRIVQTRRLLDKHLTVVDGFPVTTLARTFFDLCGDPDVGLHLRHPIHERRMKQLYNDCLARRGMTFAMEAAVLATLARRGRSGTRLVRKLLEQFGPDHVPTQSDTETLFLELVRDRGLPEPERQLAIGGIEGWIGTVDFAWRRGRVVVEIDSSWHDGPLDLRSDAERDRSLRAAGWSVLRYRFRDLVVRPDAVIRELGAAIDGSPSIAAPRTEGGVGPSGVRGAR